MGLSIDHIKLVMMMRRRVMWSQTLDLHEELYQSIPVRLEHLLSYGDSYGYNISDTLLCKHYHTNLSTQHIPSPWPSASCNQAHLCSSKHLITRANAWVMLERISASMHDALKTLQCIYLCKHCLTGIHHHHQHCYHLFLNVSFGLFRSSPVGLSSLSERSMIGSRQGMRASRSMPSLKMMRAATAWEWTLGSCKSQWKRNGQWRGMFILWFWGIECWYEHGKKLQTELFLYNLLHTCK